LPCDTFLKYFASNLILETLHYHPADKMMQSRA